MYVAGLRCPVKFSAFQRQVPVFHLLSRTETRDNTGTIPFIAQFLFNGIPTGTNRPLTCTVFSLHLYKMVIISKRILQLDHLAANSIIKIFRAESIFVFRDLLVFLSQSTLKLLTNLDLFFSCSRFPDTKGDYLKSTPSMKCLFTPDRKSTRLNSSHANISYAVFCLKKKNKTIP